MITVSRNCTLRAPKLPTSATNQRVDRAGIGRTTSRELLDALRPRSRQSRSSFAPTNGSFATQSGGGGSLKLAQTTSPSSTISSALRDDRADRRRERHDEDQQQRHGHRRHGEPALAQSRACTASITGQVDDDDHRRPDDRGEERPQDPERREDHPTEKQHRQNDACEIFPRGCHGAGRGEQGCYPPGAVRENARGGRTLFSSETPRSLLSARARGPAPAARTAFSRSARRRAA